MLPGVYPPQKIEEMLGAWLGLSQREGISELYAAALCRFLFGYIHPVFDGNGRTGRYLLSLQLSSLLSQRAVQWASQSLGILRLTERRLHAVRQDFAACIGGSMYVVDGIAYAGEPVAGIEVASARYVGNSIFLVTFPRGKCASSV